MVLLSEDLGIWKVKVKVEYLSACLTTTALRPTLDPDTELVICARVKALPLCRVRVGVALPYDDTRPFTNDFGTCRL